MKPHRSYAELPLYMSHIQNLEKKILDPQEDRRAELVRLISTAFSTIPTPSEQDSYLGQPLSREPDMSAWEQLPMQGKDREEVLAAGLSALHGQPRFFVPAVMHNINPAPLLDTVAASAVVSMYNPNMLWDFVCAGFQTLERQVFRQMGQLAGWSRQTQPDGVFAFGGKGCLTYAIRVGLNRCLPGVSSKGLSQGPSPVVITSTSNHYSIEMVCALLGIGADACIRVPTVDEKYIDLDAYSETVDRLMKDRTPIACIISSGGNSLDMTVDPAVKMREIAYDAAKRHNLNYKPFIYMDAVIGWPWLTFKNYDWKKNHLGIPTAVHQKLGLLGKHLSQTKICDAFGCDFHKTGLVPYVSSAFVIRKPAELHSIFKDTISEKRRENYGNNFIQHHSIEHSRSANSALSAWIALQNMGIDGLRSYLARLTEIGDNFQKLLPGHGLEHINVGGIGSGGVFWPKPENGPQTYQDLLRSPDKVVHDNNKRVFAIFDELALPDNNDKPIVLRYLPEYRRSKSGLPAATLVVYPMAMATTNEDINNLAACIGRTAKRLSARNAVFRPFRFNPPNHVPR